MLQFQGSKEAFTITTDCKANTDGAKGAGAYGNAGSDMIGDVRKLCKKGRLKEALHILLLMDHRGVRPNSSTYASLLQVCVNNKALSEGKLIHAHMIRTRFNAQIFLQTKLVIMYAKCGSVADARRAFEQMPKQNLVSRTAMIAAYTRDGRNQEALILFYQMQRDGIRPDKFTFASVLAPCANLAALKHGREIHGELSRSVFQLDAFVGSALVDMYAKCRRMEYARQVFDEMPARDVVLWNAVVSGYSQNGHVDEAMKLFQKMPDRNVVSWNAIITGCAQNGRVDDALKLFQKLPVRDMVSWNAIIAGYAQNGRVDEALKLFQKMSEQDVVSWTAIIAGYAQNGHVGEALSLFQKMPERNVVSWSAMITGYVQNGRVDEALNLFQKMHERNVVSWNAMIVGYAQNGYFNEALKLFRHMQLTGVNPDSFTVSSIMQACSKLVVLKNGKEVHGNIIKSGFQCHAVVGGALVDMYAKCGTIEYALRVFDKIPERNMVSWNAMILGYAKHGCGKEALQLFEQMQHSGTRPDSVTFIGVLSACSHSGLVDDGWQYFNSMSQDYYITPTMEHYSCMVDLLGRAGHLDEAHDFINKMPIKPNAVVWGSLLGACRIHANIELGERVADQLFQLDSKNAACYVPLSNIYAQAGRWDDVEKVRKTMKDKRVKKTPGCSWIEVNNKVHSFLVRDRSHPQTHKIYA